MLIGLTGKKYSGKTATATILERNENFSAISFADPVKQIVASINPFLTSQDRFSHTEIDLFKSRIHDSFLHCAYVDLTDDQTASILSTLDPIMVGIDSVQDYFIECNSHTNLKTWDNTKRTGDPRYDELRRLWQVLGTDCGRCLIDENIWLNTLAHNLSDDQNIVVPDVRFDNEAQFIRDHGGEVWLIKRPGLENTDTHASEKGVSSDLIDVTFLNCSTLADLESSVLSYYSPR